MKRLKNKVLYRTGRFVILNKKNVIFVVVVVS